MLRRYLNPAMQLRRQMERFEMEDFSSRRDARQRYASGERL